MNKNRLSHLLVFGLVLWLSACQGVGQPLRAAMVGSGDTVNGMSLATGAAEAAPLWAYCSPSQENTHIRTFQCRAPVWQTLAVGNLFLITEAALLNRNGSDFVWELSIDDHVIDLDSFGTFDYVVPAMASSPSPVREVFAKVTDWNLVMTNLNPGEHTLHIRAQNDTAQYHWLVNLVIEPADDVDMSAAPFPLHS